MRHNGKSSYGLLGRYLASWCKVQRQEKSSQALLLSPSFSSRPGCDTLSFSSHFVTMRKMKSPCAKDYGMVREKGHRLLTTLLIDPLGKRLSDCQTASCWLQKPLAGWPSQLTPAHPMPDPNLHAQGSLLNLSILTHSEPASRLSLSCPGLSCSLNVLHSQTDSFER